VLECHSQKYISVVPTGPNTKLLGHQMKGDGSVGAYVFASRVMMLFEV